jgi:type IV pilus assembly protein PilQ
MIFMVVFLVGLFPACSKKQATVKVDESTSSVLMISGVSLDVTNGQEMVKITASGEPKYNVFKLSDPERVVVDLIDAELAADVETTVPGKGGVKELKVESMKDSLSSLVRVEVYLSPGMSYLASVDGTQLNLSLTGAAMADAAPSPVESTQVPEMAPALPVPEAAPVMEAPAVEVPLPIPAPMVEVPTPEMKVEQTPSESLPVPLPTPVAGASESKEEVAPAADAAPSVESSESSKSQDFPAPRRVEDGKIKPAVVSQEIPTTNLTDGTSILTELDTKVYTGRRVSLEFQNADVQDIIRLIADVSKLNIITSDAVKGSLTLKLIDVPWDQALDIILTTLGLDKVQHGNIIRVAPAEALKKERETALANDKAAKQLEPLKLKLININYATGSELQARIKNLLSERGTVDVDDRTNTLIVKDIKENLTRIESLIKVLDTQTPQVRIESRIVQANDNFSRNFGIQWGPSLNLNDTNGKSRDFQFPREITGAGVPSGDAGTTLSGWAVDAATSSKGSQLGFRLGSVSDIFDLDLRLSYAEIESVGRVISRPNITVLDNRTARIIQGTKIPFLSSSSSGANVSFQEAGIEIQVTPHITNDGSVLMKINTRSNEPQSGDVGGNRIISIREATTEMLVKSARTAVLGGVFKTVETNSETGVPFMKDLPVVGWLFKGRDQSKNREELLIFITPYILSDNRSAATAPAGETTFAE